MQPVTNNNTPIETIDLTTDENIDDEETIIDEENQTTVSNEESEMEDDENEEDKRVRIVRAIRGYRLPDIEEDPEVIDSSFDRLTCYTNLLIMPHKLMVEKGLHMNIGTTMGKRRYMRNLGIITKRLLQEYMDNNLMHVLLPEIDFNYVNGSLFDTYTRLAQFYHDPLFYKKCWDFFYPKPDLQDDLLDYINGQIAFFQMDLENDY